MAGNLLKNTGDKCEKTSLTENTFHSRELIIVEDLEPFIVVAEFLFRLKAMLQKILLQPESNST